MKRLFGLIFVMIISTFMLSAQVDTTQKKEGFQFTIIKENPTTSVKDQSINQYILGIFYFKFLRK